VLDGDQTNEAFSTAQLASLEKALARATQTTGFDFTIYVGGLAEGRASAQALAMGLPNPDGSVLIAVDPQVRALEIVTGAGVVDRLDDQSCRLATLTMTSRFAIGDIAAGLRDGVLLLAEHARRFEPILHTDTPE